MFARNKLAASVAALLLLSVTMNAAAQTTASYCGVYGNTDSVLCGFNVDPSAAGTNSTSVGNSALGSGTNSTALGANASATANNAVALGAGSIANQVNTVSIGDGTTNRRLVNLAAGIDPTDAVNMSQLAATNQAIANNTTAVTNDATNITTLQGNSLLFNRSLNAFDASHSGVDQLVTNVAAGTLSSTSTDAVNGSQLYATNQNVASNTAAITTDETNITTLQSNSLLYSPSLGGFDASRGGVDQVITHVAPGAIGANSTDAVNGSQLYAVSQAVTAAGGWSLSANGKAPVTVAPGDTVNVASGSSGNLSVTQQGDDLTIDTNPNLTASTFTSGNAVLSSAGLSIAGGPSLVSLGAGGLDNGGNQIFNVAAGTSALDAVNLSQLNAAVAGINTTIVNLTSSMQYFAANGDGSGTTMATGTDAVAAGQDAQATGVTSTAIGGAANASGASATAVGTGTKAAGAASTAIGANASAPANNAVALGAGSVADRANTVSVGSATNTRQVTNVAAGTEGTDAVNVAQLDASTLQAVATANSYTDQQLSGINDQFAGVNRRIDTLATQQGRNCAMGAAMTQMAMAGAGAGEGGRVSAGVGMCSGGYSGVAVGFATPISERVHLSFGASASGSQGEVGAGIGWDLH